MEDTGHYRIDSALQICCFGEYSNDTRVVDGVGAREEAAFAIFEPLGEDLIAANLVGPEVGGDTIEVLGRIDADASAVGVVLDLGDGAVALATETADRVVEFGRTH